jgi:hypothetical protein
MPDWTPRPTPPLAPAPEQAQVQVQVQVQEQLEPAAPAQLRLVALHRQASRPSRRQARLRQQRLSCGPPRLSCHVQVGI